MVLGIAEDFSSNIALDSQLTSIPSSGLYLNSGVHPSISVDNLLSFLPLLSISPSAWDYTKTYSEYESVRSKNALVTHNGKIYQSLKASNLNKNPSTQPTYWLETNLESLRLKSFIDRVKDKVYADLNLTKRLVNNQFLYEVGENTTTLPNDYCGWVFEPKGSDYVSFRINEIAIQKSGITPINLYVVNQGILIDTLSITPKNGKLEFDTLDYVFSGKGKWQFVIDSTDVITNSGYIDPLKYDGFLAYTCVGIGNAPNTATYSWGNTGNGLGFNITAYLDSSLYIENNLNEFANYIRSTFEYMTFQMMLSNSNNRSNMAQRLQGDIELLKFQTLDTNPAANSSVNRYYKEMQKAVKQLEKTFDTQLSATNGGLEINLGSI